eukprot:7879326-Pyramimonas_sp.AAC.1
MIFEVQDLAVASPATVSRCGMVYMQPSQLGWRPPMLSWLDTLPATLDDDNRECFREMLDWLAPPLIRVAMRGVKAPVPMQVRLAGIIKPGWSISNKTLRT